MPITRHHSGRWLFQFDRVIPGAGRQRANKLLPKGWSKAKAQEYDQREVARLYELATGGKQPEPLIDAAVLVYLEQHAPGLKNFDDIVAALDILSPFYTGKTMADLAEVAERYVKEARAEDGKPLQAATVRNRLAYLRAACRWAWKKKKMGSHDPAERMVLPKVQNERHVYLTRAQAVSVFRAMGMSWSRDAARVAFYTGWRISEVLRAVPVETGEGLVLAIQEVGATKNGRPKLVPVHHKIEHLARRHWPLQVTKWTVSKETKAALRAVGLGHARLHDLRHSAASAMINAGIDLYTVGGVLGHKSQASTARYAHLATDRLREAVGRIGAKPGGFSQPGGAKKAA
jgi:integrase